MSLHWCVQLVVRSLKLRVSFVCATVITVNSNSLLMPLCLWYRFYIQMLPSVPLICVVMENIKYLEMYVPLLNL